MNKFKKVFDVLNGVETVNDLKRLGFKLVDLEYSKATFYDLQKSYNKNNGQKTTARTLLKTVADFYKKHGFKVSGENGIFKIEYLKA